MPNNNTKALAPIDQFKKRLEKSRDVIWKQKADWLQLEKANWFEKALMYITGESFLLQCMSDKKGQFAVLKCLMNACSMGLEFGGMYPQAYIVPFKGVPTLIPTAVGLMSVVMTEPRVVSDIKYSLVHKNESCSIDIAGGEVTHTFSPIKHDGERGDPVGGYVIVTDMEDRPHVTYMSKSEINKIRDNSLAKMKNPAGSAWSQFWSEMALKTIMKKAVKPFLPLKSAKMRAIEEEESAVHISDDDLEAYQEMSIEERVLKTMENGKQPEEPVITEPAEEKTEPPPGDGPGLF